MSYKSKKTQSPKLSKGLCCCNCNLQFYIRDINLKESKCPILLECGHSFCDTCLFQGSRTSKLTCKQCGFTSKLEQAHDSLPLNLYGLGCLVALKFENDKRLSFLASNDPNFHYAPKEQQKSEQPNIEVCEECSLPALWFCENCKSNFCERCWTSVHGSAKSLMKHLKVLCSKRNPFQTALKRCPDHESQNLEFFCKGCSVVICPHCIILNHQGEGHCPITLKDKNLELVPEVKKAAEDAEVICKRMKQTLEKIKLLFSTGNSRRQYPSYLEGQITSSFARIHGILQLEEARLLKTLEDKINGREMCLKKLRTQLESQIENVVNLLNEFEVLTKAPQTGDMADLHQKLLDVQNFPCYLISIETPVQKEVKLTFDDDFIESIRSYCSLNLPAVEEFQLKSSQNLPEDYVVNELDLDFTNSEQTLTGWHLERNDSEIDSLSVCSSKNFNNSELDLPARCNDTEFLHKPTTFVENKVYSVRMTFIKNPGEFYVSLNSQQGKQRFIDKRASQVAERSLVVPTHLAKDCIYLVKYRGDEKWYRGRITQIFSEEKGQDDQVEIYYLDYGNSEIVPKSRLRPIPQELLEEAPLAIKCKLFDCIPKNGEWCVESRNVMRAMLENSTASMFVMKVQPDILEVDLSKVSQQSQIGCDIVSVRDALVFLEFVNLVGGIQKVSQIKPLKYQQQALPFCGDSFEVLVTHVNSPSDFYVQKFRQCESWAQKLLLDLQHFYKNHLKEGIIYNPVAGMPCAAIFPEDHKWYRAIIEDVPGKKMITVFYVDYGNRETVPWACVRNLKENFLKFPPMAMHCTLGDHRAEDSNYWDSRVVAYMKQTLEQKKCRIKLLGKLNGKKKIRVLLHQKFGKKTLCLNVSLVEMNNAFKSPSNCSKSDDCQILEEFSSGTPYSSERKEKKIEVLHHKCAEDTIKTASFIQKKSKPSVKALRDQHAVEKIDQQLMISDAEEFVSNQGDLSSTDDVLKVSVEILSAESPSSIYVTFPALKAVLKNLQEKLADFYENTVAEDFDWTPDCKCVVYSASKNGWYRATVLKIFANDTAELFLKDIATVSVEPVSCLRILNQDFLKYATCTVKCHLSDVRPAGDEWPSISCEFLCNELSNYEHVYITKNGEIDNNSLPIELWVQKVVPGAALEPTVKEWITLNRMLVDQGLAVPVKTGGVRSSFRCLEDEYFSENFRQGTKTVEKSLQCHETSENDLEQAMTSKRRKKDVEDDEKKEAGDKSFVPTLSFKWLPASPLKCSRFVGVPTYVDCNACIFLYDVEEGEELLKKIRKSLQEEFENSSPSPEDYFWSPGQVCVVRYHVDDFWYRGLVLQVNEDLTYNVLFVDYGNTEICQASEMRKRIKTADTPILTRKFQLRGIVPVSEDGQWPIPVIDLLHATIVEKYCQVVVWNESCDADECPEISLKLIEEDIVVSTFLIERNLAEYSKTVYLSSNCSVNDENESMSEAVLDSEPSASPSDEKASLEVLFNQNFRYIPLDIPSDCGNFYIKITTIISENEFFANLTKGDQLPSEIMLCLENFETLQKDMASRCEFEPKLQNFDIGRPCCCFYSDDRTWKRAQIEAYDQSNESASVLCVDCGNKDYLKKNLLRECPIEWLSVPKMAIKFKLVGVEKCSDISKSAVINALIDHLIGKVFFAEVTENCEEYLKVRLLTEKNGPLAYQNMIDDALLKFIE